MARFSLLRAASALGLASGAVVAACSLGLDESLLDRPVDGGDVPDASVDPSPPDARADAGPREAGLTCAKDEDCVTANACLRGRCDLERKACVFDACRPSACNAGTCDLAASACKDVKPYALRPSTFKVGAAAAARSVAAVYPYLFVGTATGVVAFDVANPAAPGAPVPVLGLAFVPSFFLTSGSRVFFFGAPVGPGATTRVPLAWVDVPREPFAKQLRASDVLAGWNRPAGEAVAAYARPDDGALVFTSAAGLPAAALPTPPSERFDLVSVATPLVPGTAPVAMSGTRLLVQALDAVGNTAFGFVPNAGTSAVSDAGLTTANADAGGAIVAAPQAFAQTAGGAVLWSFAALAIPPSQPGATVRALRAVQLVAGESATPNASGAIDVEVYPANTYPPGTAVTGPLAALDADTAMVTALARESAAQTSVQFVKRQPFAVVKNADGQPRRAVLPHALGALAGVAGSNGIGYVVANDAPVQDQPPNATVYVFDPACAP